MIKLILGDCLEKMKNIPDNSIDLVLTDPPYNKTQCSWDSIIPFEPMWQHLKRIAKPDKAIILFGSQPFTSGLITSNLPHFKYCWAWDKINPTGHLNAKKRPMKKLEDIVVFSYGKVPYYPQGLVWNPRTKTRNSNTQGSKCYGKHESTNTATWEGYPTERLEFKNENGLHPTQKSVPLLEYLIKTYTHENEVVLDFSAGSFSTAIAAINTNRKFIGMEKDKNYFNVGKQRIETHLKGFSDEELHRP